MENTNAPPTCLILEPVGVVADDLKSMVQEEYPETRVVIVHSMDEALDVLQTQFIDIAFLNLSPTALSGSVLAERLAEMSASVVFIGYEAEAGKMDHRYLERPFVNRAIADELKPLRQRALCKSLDDTAQPS